MPELKLGTKYECFSCGTKFYDLGKPEPLCPKCGANQKDGIQAEATAASQAARRKRKSDLAKTIEVDDDEPMEEIGDDDLLAADLADLGDADEEEELEDDEE